MYPTQSRAFLCLACLTFLGCSLRPADNECQDQEGMHCTDVSFSPDGKTAVVGCATLVDNGKLGKMGTIAICRTDDWKVVRRIQCEFFPLYLSYSTDLNKVVASTLYAQTQLWDLKEGRPIQIARDKDGIALDGLFLKDGITVVSPVSSGKKETDERGLRFWNTSTGKITWWNDAGGDLGCTAVARSADGAYLAAGYYEGVKIWDVKARKVVYAIEKQHNITRVAFSADGEILGAAGRNGTNPYVTLFNIRKSAEHAVFKDMKGVVAKVAFSPSGDVLAVCDASREVRLYSVVKKVFEKVIQCPETVNTCVFSPDGRQLLMPMNNSQLGIWDTKTQESRTVTISVGDS